MDSSTEQVGDRRSPLRIAIILITITSVLSLLYAVQYYLGGPIRLSAVSPFRDVAVQPEGSLVAAGAENGIVYLWEVPPDFDTVLPGDFDLAEEERWTEHRLAGHRDTVLALAFTADGSTLVSIDRSGRVVTWEGLPGASPVEQSLGGGPLAAAAFDAAAARVAMLGENGQVRVWDLESGQELRSLGPVARGSIAVDLSDDGTLVAAGDGPNVQVWSVTGDAAQQLAGYWQDPEIEENWQGHTKAVTALAFSPDNELLASGSADTTVMFWEVATGEVRWPAEGHWATVTSAQFEPTGDFLLTTGRDNTVRNLRTAGGKSTASYTGHLNTVMAAAYGPLADTLVSAGGDGTLRVWGAVNQNALHMEWSRYGFQPTWGGALAVWMLLSGLVGLVVVRGMRRRSLWSHLLAITLFLVGPVVVLGLPLFEVLSYPLMLSTKLSISWPLLALVAWYVFLLAVLLRAPVAGVFEAPQGADLSQQIMISQRTRRTRLGISGLAVWIGLLVILYSLLRRFNLDIAFMGHFFSFIMAGAGLTLAVSAASILLAIVLAILGALGRLSTNPIPNGIASFYISLIRGTPLLVQIFIWYLGLPQLGIILQPLTAGVLALGVNYGAYMTETFRAGIQAISKGQREAAQALGMTGAQTFRRIIVPQAFRIVIPPIGNDFIAMMKDSSLVYIMGVWELTFRAQKIGRQNFRTMETFLIAAAFYWLLTVVFQFLQGKLEDYLARSERR
ncbi:MAG TPA: ABC transporter permease subunit [Anaerolineae bacterium]|nr:ABC transporter permease subunit [Anaerolineae bacterium]